MTAHELSAGLAMLGALDSFKRHLWNEWQETISEHVAHMNKIGVRDFYGYVFMGLHWEASTEGFEYWYAVANAFGREKQTLINNGNGRKEDIESNDNCHQE